MSVIYIVLPLALIMAVLAIFAFIWATRGGQFDDLDSAAVRMLFDDEERRGPGGEKHKP